MSEAAALTPAEPKPDHVPDSAVYDFDFFNDPAYLQDPHDRILDLVRHAPPVFWTPRNGGHWMLLSHAANYHASRDTESFSSELIPQSFIRAALAELPPDTPHIPQPIPINVDPPEHSRFRVPLNKVFSPRAVNELKEGIRELARRLVDDVIANGRCEFISAIAEPLPVQVFLKMMGLPLDRQEEYRRLVADQLANATDDVATVIEKLQRITASMRGTLIERRENPRDDIISMLWSVDIDGRPPTMEDMDNYCVLLFIAGLDTVVNGIGHGIRHLASDPVLQQLLRSEPRLIGQATEELLRRYTFTVPARRVAKDLVFQGVQMLEDEKVMLFLPAASLDPAEYSSPEVFDIQRESKAHIAFNAGPHRCLGSHLARLELQIVYEEVLARLPSFRLAPGSKPRFSGGHIIGIKEMHLIWDQQDNDC